MVSTYNPYVLKTVEENDIHIVRIYLGLLVIENNIFKLLKTSKVEDNSIKEFKQNLKKLREELKKIQKNEMTDEQKEQVEKNIKYSESLQQYLYNGKFEYDVSYEGLEHNVDENIKKATTIIQKLENNNFSENKVLHTLDKLQSIREKVSITCPNFDELSFKDKQKCIRNQLYQFNNDADKYLQLRLQKMSVEDLKDYKKQAIQKYGDKIREIETQISKVSGRYDLKKSTAIIGDKNREIENYRDKIKDINNSKNKIPLLSKYISDKLEHSFNRRYNYLLQSEDNFYDYQTVWYPYIRNNPDHNGKMLYALLDEKQKQDVIKCLTSKEVEDIIDGNENGNTENVQVVYFHDNLDTFDNKTKDIIKSKTNSYIDTLKKTLAEDVKEFKNQDSTKQEGYEFKEFWGYLQYKYIILRNSGLSDEKMKKEFKHMQDDIDKSPEDDPVRVLKRKGDRRETCEKPFYWVPEAVKYKRDKDGKETEELNPLYKKFIKENIFFCEDYKKIPYEVLLPLTFGNIYKIDGSDESNKYRQLVLQRYVHDDSRILSNCLVCFPEYFITSQHTLFTNYYNLSEGTKIYNKKIQLYYLLSWSIIYNYLLIQCGTYNKNNYLKDTIFPVRLLLDNTLKNSNYYIYFSNYLKQEDITFIGIITLKIPYYLKNENYTIFLFIFKEKDHLNIYNFDGSSIDIQSGLYIAMIRITFREIYYIKKKNNYKFYEWVEPLENKNNYYNLDEKIIMGSPYNSNEIIKMYKKELEDLKRLSLNKNIKEIQEKLNEKYNLENYTKKLYDLIQNPDKYFKEINLTYGKKSVFEIKDINLQNGGNIYYSNIRNNIRNIKDNKNKLKNIYNNFYINFLIKQQLKSNIIKTKVTNKTYNNSKTIHHLKSYKLNINKNESIIQNNELFQFIINLLYWILFYKFINKNMFWIGKNYTNPTLIKYYSKIFEINLN